jgi:betaine lipid synthase
MASLIPNILAMPKDPHTQIIIVGASIMLLVGFIFATTLTSTKKTEEEPGFFVALGRFVYSCFLKPHERDSTGSQQDALESFYKVSFYML